MVLTMHTNDPPEPALDKNTTTYTKTVDPGKSGLDGKNTTTPENVEEARNARIALLTTPRHKAAIEAAADEAGQTLTAYVMRRALAGGMVRP